MKETNLWTFIKNHIEKDDAVILMVVVDSENSSPGRAGFKMAVSKSKEMIGSIGGGLMEHNLVDETVESLKSNQKILSLKKLFHHGDLHEDSSGMICSGSQTQFIIPLDQNDLPTIEKIISSIRQNKKSAIKLDQNGLSWISNDLKQEQIFFSQINEENWSYQENIGHQDRIFIIGGGHVGLALSKVMSFLSFYVVIIDDRANLQTMESNEYADEKKVIDYNEIGDHLIEGDNAYIAIVSHTFKTDELILRNVIDKNFRYIGMMGSKAKVKEVINNLKHSGIDEEKIKSIHSPIGIQINSETPEEIAISIAAEIIKIRNS